MREAYRNRFPSNKHVLSLSATFKIDLVEVRRLRGE